MTTTVTLSQMISVALVVVLILGLIVLVAFQRVVREVKALSKTLHVEDQALVFLSQEMDEHKREFDAIVVEVREIAASVKGRLIAA